MLSSFLCQNFVLALGHYLLPANHRPKQNIHDASPRGLNQAFSVKTFVFALGHYLLPANHRPKQNIHDVSPAKYRVWRVRRFCHAKWAMLYLCDIVKIGDFVHWI